MNEQKIVDLYINDSRSTYEIATLFNTYPNKIRRVLLKNKIELKNKSEAQKNALDKGTSKIPTQGRKRSKEERLKISKSQKLTWSKIDKKKYDSHVARAKQRWNEMPDEEKERIRSLAIKAIQVAGKEGSKLEKFLKIELTKIGHTVEIHKKDLIPNENLEIDMFFPKLKAIIEIDGPSHFVPIWGEEKLQKQIKADSQKTGLILNKGFAIIRVKHMSDSLSLAEQEDLKNNIAQILNGIEQKFPPKSKRYIEINA